jgi:hypothetical protein
MRHDLTNRTAVRARAQATDVHAAARIFNTMAVIGGLLLMWVALVAL